MSARRLPAKSVIDVADQRVVQTIGLALDPAGGIVRGARRGGLGSAVAGGRRGQSPIAVAFTSSAFGASLS
jgi:hypothetical protein